jgi:hypothetical protein
MENIIEPNETFDFTKLTLTQPTVVQGGAYFTRILYGDKPLYIQTTKSLTRQGFVKTGKKYYCDLMFDGGASNLIHWFENLEEKCIKLIYEKSDTWFQNALEMSDVESAFNSIIRIYKSGKFYLVRTNVKSSTTTNEPAIKIYNENEIPLTHENINNETNIISILEIQGIKFTSRNFQIEIELKQIMVLDNEPIFESCLIKSNKKNIATVDSGNQNQVLVSEDSLEENFGSNGSNDLETLERIPEEELEIKDNKDNINDNNNILEEVTMVELERESEVPEELKEFDFDFDLPLEKNNKNDELESLTLKKPNQVYFELYKNARIKAKEAKKSLILAYLEAKNIKKTYMLDNLNDDSDSDLDAEIDDISESELEGL